MIASLLAAAAGALLALAFPPIGLWPAAMVGLVPLLALARIELPRRRRYLAAYFGGLVFFVGGCHWLVETSWINLALMAFPEALAFPLFVAAVRRLRPVPVVLAAPICWTGIEVVRAHWPFNGYPWLMIGGAFAQSPRLLQTADLAGVFGLTFLAAFWNGALFDAARTARRRPLVAASLLLACAATFAAAWWYGGKRIDEVAGQIAPGPRVALVQANIAQQLKHAEKKTEEIVGIQLAATRAACAAAKTEPFDVLCWAETMFPFPIEDEAGDEHDVWFRDSNYGPRSARRVETELIAGSIVQDLLKPIGASLLLGVPTMRGATPQAIDVRNSVVAFDAEGRRVGRYSKVLLVPGGEFIPLRSALPDFVFRWIESVAGFIPALTPGDGPTLIELRTRAGRRFTIAPTICYENAYPVFTAQCAALAPDFLINFSNEGWFGASAEFDQMDAMTRLRAVENRRTIVRCTNTGISAVSDPLGRRTAALVDSAGRDRAIAGHLIAEAPLCVAHAPFTANAGRIRAAGWMLMFAALLVRVFFRPRSGPGYRPEVDR